MAHPVHPALVHFPIACWTIGSFADLASFKIGEAAWRLAGIMLLTGCVMALAAMISGLIEYGKIEQNGAAARDANRHMLWVFGAWTAYVSSLFARLDGMKLTAPDLLSGSLSLLGFLILCVAAWYGGQLVYRHGVGVTGKHEKTIVDKSRG